MIRRCYKIADRSFNRKMQSHCSCSWFKTNLHVVTNSLREFVIVSHYSDMNISYWTEYVCFPIQHETQLLCAVSQIVHLSSYALRSIPYRRIILHDYELRLAFVISTLKTTTRCWNDESVIQSMNVYLKNQGQTKMVKVKFGPC